MKIVPMYTGKPGMADLVHHTVKHFLAPGEREAWDRIPAGTGTESFAMNIPRYELLAAMLGDAPGPRWERQGKRWLGDVHGFRLVVEPRGPTCQLISAFFSHTFRHDDHPDDALRAFRAFAARRDCPPAAAPGVPAPETKS